MCVCLPVCMGACTRPCGYSGLRLPQCQVIVCSHAMFFSFFSVSVAACCNVSLLCPVSLCAVLVVVAVPCFHRIPWRFLLHSRLRASRLPATSIYVLRVSQLTVGSTSTVLIEASSSSSRTVSSG